MYILLFLPLFLSGNTAFLRLQFHPHGVGELMNQTAQMSRGGDLVSVPSPHISLYGIASERHFTTRSY